MDCQKDQHESLCSRAIGSRPSCPGVVSDLELTVSKGMGHQRRRVWFSLEEVKLLVEAVKQTNVMKSLDIVLLCPETQVSTPRTPMQVGQYEPSAIDSDVQVLQHSAISERVKFPHITPDKEKVTHKGQLSLIRHLLRSHISRVLIIIGVLNTKSTNRTYSIGHSTALSALGISCAPCSAFRSSGFTFSSGPFRRPTLCSTSAAIAFAVRLAAPFVLSATTLLSLPLATPSSSLLGPA